MPVDHVGEDAELYALGSLDDVGTRAGRSSRPRVRRVRAPHRRRRGDRAASHRARRAAGARTARARAAGNARRRPRPRAVTAAGSPPLRRPFSSVYCRAGIARVQQRGASGDTLAASAMLAGHFSHAPFVALAAGAPKAKAIYPLEGGWLYIIAAPGAALDIAHRARRTPGRSRRCRRARQPALSVLPRPNKFRRTARRHHPRASPTYKRPERSVKCVILSEAAEGRAVEGRTNVSS